MNLKNIFFIIIFINATLVSPLLHGSQILKELATLTCIESAAIATGIVVCSFIRKSIEPNLPKIDQNTLNLYHGMNCLPIHQNQKYDNVEYAIRHFGE